MSTDLQWLETFKWIVKPLTPVKFSTYLLFVFYQPNCIIRIYFIKINKHHIIKMANKILKHPWLLISRLYMHFIKYTDIWLNYLYMLVLYVLFSSHISFAYTTILISINLIDTVTLPQEDRYLFIAWAKCTKTEWCGWVHFPISRYFSIYYGF